MMEVVVKRFLNITMAFILTTSLNTVAQGPSGGMGGPPRNR